MPAIRVSFAGLFALYGWSGGGPGDAAGRLPRNVSAISHGRGRDSNSLTRQIATQQ